MYDRPAIVYVATNMLNGRCYVGVTHKSLDERRRRHEKSSRAKRPTCRVFHEAIRQYGADAFDWKVLKRGITFAEALREEVAFIVMLRPEYNLTAGGQGSNRHARSEESKARQRAAMTGRRHSAETRRRISAVQIGRCFSPATRAKISAALKGKVKSAAHAQRLSAVLSGNQNLSAAQKKLWAAGGELAARRLAGLVRHRQEREAGNFR